ncbi:hypothetical protein HPP92_027324 [Vanilla planifolia]|uniref:Uncharacterized protein n=1 Tax=Vanilla planifolia TaxID=51239 RepID=A0A835P9E8_VANPL|nr:hypothetical protein HPP92_027324 [Vanilla planifolia]KAG0449465.1 hypothetical protein HPP92_027348 [Vanilla planifolia]
MLAGWRESRFHHHGGWSPGVLQGRADSRLYIRPCLLKAIAPGEQFVMCAGDHGRRQVTITAGRTESLRSRSTSEVRCYVFIFEPKSTSHKINFEPRSAIAPL